MLAAKLVTSKPVMTPAKKISIITVCILGGLLIAPFVLIFIIMNVPLIIFFETRAALSRRNFRRRESGFLYLICTSRRNWHNFLKNNVIPVLPVNFRVVWHKSHRGGGYPDILHNVHRSNISRVSKPYLVAVNPRALVHKSLNLSFQELKSTSKKSETTRRACAAIIAEAEKELRDTYFTKYT